MKAFSAILLLLLSASLSFADNVQHPILSISGSGSGASSVTNISESTYTNSFTPRTPPRNDGYGFAPPVVSGDSSWSWSASSPTQIVSKPSNTVFPNTNTALYPVRTQVVSVFLTTATNNLTRNVNALYYNKAGSTTSKALIFNLIDYHKLSQLRSDFNKLAPAYINSGGTPAARNDNYARRIAIALLDWSRWHPSYYLTAINSASFIDVTPNYLATTSGFGPQRASDHNGLAHEWQDDELRAFDAIYNSVALTNLSTEMGFDVRQYICDNLFFDEGDFLVNHIPVDIAIQSNLSGPYAVLPTVGRVLDRPDYILWMDGYLDATVRKKIRRDGALEEGEGYSIGYLNSNQDAAQNTRDYFLTRAATNSLLLAISNRATIYNATLTYGQAQWATIALPNGQLPSFGDTPFNNYFSARNKGNSALLPAYGTLSLGAGTSSGSAVQLNQNFSGDNNHMRADMNAFVLWAFNNEYLGNIRYYNGSIGRNFGEQMLAYNTVTIDRVNLTPYSDADTYGNGNLTIYEPDDNGLALTEIDGQRAYSSKASRFQRLLLLNTVDLTKPYVVDVFRVTGGTNHDYTFHGSVRWDQNAQCSFPLVTNNNLYPMLQGTETWNPSDDTPYYGFWRNVSSNTAPGNFQITYSDTNRSSGRDTRLWMTADPNTYNVFLGTTPVPARDNTVPTNFFNSLGLKRPSAIIRHRISGGTLQDLFVSVVEPFNGGVSNIVSVERLPMNGGSLDSCAVRITFKDGRVDTCLVNLRNPKIAGANTGSATISTADGDYTLNGRVGVQVDRPGGIDSRVWTVNATDFKYPRCGLTTPGTSYSGWISGETRKLNGATYDAFTTTAPLPTDGTLQNKFLSLTHGNLSSGTPNISEMFKIDRVVFTNGLYHICFTNDHMLEITGATSVEQVAPLRTFTTSNSFEIVLTAFARQISPIPDQNILPGSSSAPINFDFGNLGSTSGSSLQIFATSSNQALIPDSNLVISGSGTSRSLTITPATGQTGTSLITVSVTDGLWTNSRSFNAFVGTFAVVTSPSSQSVLAGGSIDFTNVLVATNGSGIASFSVSGLPIGTSAGFNPATVTDAGTNTLSISVSNTVAPGAYPLTIFATTGSQFASNIVTLIVNVINATPGWSTWLGGGTGNYWSDVPNWSSAAVAGNSLAFGGVLRVNNTNNTPADTTYSNIVFNPGAAAFSLKGNSITLAGGITNNSSVPQTIALGIDFANSITFNGASNALIIAGGLTNTFGTPGSTTLTFAGAGVLKNSLKSTSNPGGTNLILLNTGTANWKLTDNEASTFSTVPWVLAVNNGTFSFGDETNAPRLTLTTPNNSPQDNQVGSMSGATGIFNMNNGMLTTTARINTASALNTTGVINQTGGTLNIGNQFQGANGSNLGELSIVNVNGGVMNIGSAANPTSPFYVASRGTGVLNVSDTGLVSCGKLDISRNASGNTVSSAGTVNLDGGTLAVTSVTNISANQQTGGSPTATFNFNGGTLVAKPGSASRFFQGSKAVPVTPIKTVVKTGGAIIDDGGNAVTIGEPLQHDQALGGNSDGGLTKLNSGTLTLISTNSYTGDTLINSGTLSLSGVGSIADSANIFVGTNAVLDVSARTDGKLTLVTAQTFSGYGTIKGDLAIAGAISLGADEIGVMTNIGSTILSGGGRYILDMDDATGETGVSWDLLLISGGLTVQATSGNPFVVQLRSIDNNSGDGESGAANFGNNSSQSWIIASANAITNFSANRFVVDDSAFQNDLAGGYFVVQTNASELLLSFMNNNPPSANDVSFHLPMNGELKIPISALAAQWSDPDGDPVQFSNVNLSSASGTNNVSSDGEFIYYTSSAGTNSLPDDIFYTITDMRTNPPAVYRAGDTIRMSTGVIHILPTPNFGSIQNSGTSLLISVGNGVPDETFYLLTTTNISVPITNWTIIGTNHFDENGSWIITNDVNTNLQQQFYRLLLP